MLRIRLRRGGATHSPYYRIVVSDSRRTPKASNIEQIGYYNPAKKPAVFEVDRERIDYWVAKGARPSETLLNLLKKQAKASSSEGTD